MWRFCSVRRISVFDGVWAALSSAIARTLLRRRLHATLLTGALVTAGPMVEGFLRSRPMFRPLLMYYAQLRALINLREQRRYIREWERERRDMIERFGVDPEAGPHRELITLRRVIPIGKTHRIEGGILMLLSLESYDEGCRGHIRLALDVEPEQPDGAAPDSIPPMPHIPVLVVTDDRGGRYPMVPNGGLGSMRMHQFEFLMTEPLDPRARELTVEIPEIRWERHDRGGRAGAVDRVIAGPWASSVDI